MWPSHVWFMWSWGRLCLIWPITDGLACSMFLFPQCHSHNPSPRAEPKACLAVIICRVFASLRMCGWVCVLMWLHSNMKMKSSCAAVHARYMQRVRFLSRHEGVLVPAWSVGRFVCALRRITLQETLSSRLSCDWRSIRTRILSSHFTWCVLPAMEWMRGWAKQTTCSPGGLL